MNHRRRVLSLLLLLGGMQLASNPRSLGAQRDGGSTFQADGSPHFLLISGGQRVPVDGSRVPSLRHRMSVSLHGVRLEQALTTITKSAGLSLFYSKAHLQLDKLVDLEASDITVAAALTDVLLDANVDVLFSSTGQAALVPRADVVVPPPAGSISGLVADSVSNAPLSGVQISVDGRAVANTGSDGRYRVATVAPGAHTVTARRLGYALKSRDVTVIDGVVATVDFSLNAVASALTQVVVTGAGTQAIRGQLATTINSVDTTLLARQGTPQNLLSALQGAAPGVEVRQQSGEPGSSVAVYVRGISTLTGSAQPLFVVDGVPIDNSVSGQVFGGFVTSNRAADINPNDIESIDILKGAAAGAIYGARGSNGVVLITTKHATTGAVRWSFNTTASSDHAMTPFHLQTVYGQGTNGVADAPTCGITTASCSVGAFGPVLAVGTPAYNHINDIFRTGSTLDNALSVSGGDSHSSFLASGGLTTQQGTMIGPNNNYTRYTGRVIGNIQLSPSVLVGGSVNYIQTNGNYLGRGDNLEGMLLASFRTPPEFNNSPYLNAAGSQRTYRFPRPAPGTDTLSHGYDNPFWIANVPPSLSRLGRAIANVNLAWTPSAWLNVKEVLGVDNYNDQRLTALPLSASSVPTGQVSQLLFSNLQIDHNLTATITNDFTRNINSTLTIGQNLNSRRLGTIGITGNRLIAPQPYTPQNTSLVTAAYTQSLDHIQSYFMQEQLNLYQQLYLTVGVRDDGFSTFGANQPTALYPKASAAWDVTNFLGNKNHSGKLSYLKMRAAFGETGKEPPLYAAVSGLTNTAVFGSNFTANEGLGLIQSGNGGIVSSSQLGNPNLRPERQRELEGGVDIGFLDQRIDLAVTLYSKRATDIILPVPVNTWQTGAYTEYENAATVSNRGAEIALNLHILDKRNVGWDLGINFATNSSKVLALRGTSALSLASAPGDNIGEAIVGYAPGVFYGGDFIKCGRGIQANVGLGGVSNIDQICAQATGGLKSGALFLGANGQPIVDPTSRVVGDPNPRYMLNYNTTLRLGSHIRISSLIDVRSGGQVWDQTRAAMDRFGSGTETLVRSGTGIFGQNYLTNLYPNVAGPGVGVTAFSTLPQWQAWFSGAGGGSAPNGEFIEDGSFVKWRELSVTYSYSGPLMRYSGFSTLDVRVAGRNLATWTKYKGMDPEANLYGAASLTQGIDVWNPPQIRSYVLSLSFNR